MPKLPLPHISYPSQQPCQWNYSDRAQQSPLARTERGFALTRAGIFSIGRGSLNRQLRVVLWVFFLLGGKPLTAVAQTPDCSNMQTQLDMNTCAGLNWERADLALNEAFQTLTPNLSESRKSALVEAQLQWIEFRDAECQFSSSWAQGGSLQPALTAGCLAELTEQRTIELKSYSQGEYPPALTDSYGSVRQQFDGIYQQLQRRLSASRQLELEAANQAWVSFRETACEFERSGGGNTALTNCLIRLTEARIDRLRNHLDSP